MTVELRDPAEVIAALEEPGLVPPPAADPSSAATARLRSEMARFSGPDEQPARRAAVVAAIELVDVARAAELAAERTAARLTGGPVEVLGAIAGVVPTETLAACLGIADDGQLVSDVEAVVRVIGRGEQASATSDAATDRLYGRCRHLQCGPVPAISLLYQDFDATAALIGVTLAGRLTRRPAAPAVPRTRRRAFTDVDLAGRTVAAGSDVVLEIGAAGLPFGAGPHRCPGRELAEAIAAAVVEAVVAAGYRSTGEIPCDADGRPTALSCAPLT